MKRLATLLAIALLPATSFAQTFPEVGARALGLGGAFVAVADGPTAAFWNPAAMPANPPSSTFLWSRSTSDPEGLAGRLDDLAATRATDADIASRPADALRAAELLGAIGSEPDPIFGNQPIGAFYSGGVYGFSAYRLTLVEAAPIVDGLRIGVGPDPATSLTANQSTLRLRSLRMQDYVLSIGGALGDPRVMLGASARLTKGETRVSAPSLFGFPDFGASDVFAAADDGDKLSGTQLSFDVGSLISIHPRVRVGVVGKYLGTPEFDTSDGDKIRIQPRWRSGVAIFPVSQFMLSADIDLSTTSLGPNAIPTRNGAIGAQLTLAEGRLAIRGGVRDSLEGPKTRLVTGGLGYIGDNFVIDVAVGHAPRSGSTTLAVEFGYRAAAKKR